MKIKQLLCKHDYEFIAKSKIVSENLFQCKKCGQLYIQHWGLGVGCKITPNDTIIPIAFKELL